MSIKTRLFSGLFWCLFITSGFCTGSIDGSTNHRRLASQEVRKKLEALNLSWEQIVEHRYLDSKDGLLIVAHQKVGDKIRAAAERAGVFLGEITGADAPISKEKRAKISFQDFTSQRSSQVEQIKEFVEAKKRALLSNGWPVGDFAKEPGGDFFLGTPDQVIWAMEHFHDVMQQRMEQKAKSMFAHYIAGVGRIEQGKEKILYSSSIGADSYVPPKLAGTVSPGNSGSGLVTLQHGSAFVHLLGPDNVRLILDSYFGEPVSKAMGERLQIPASAIETRVHRAQEGSLIDGLQVGESFDVWMAIVPYTSDPGYLGGIGGLFPQISREERALYYQMIYLHFLEQYGTFLPDMIMVSHASHIPPLAMAAAAVYGIRPAVVPVLHGTEEAAMKASEQKYDGSLQKEWIEPLMEVDGFSAITLSEAREIVTRIGSYTKAGFWEDPKSTIHGIGISVKTCVDGRELEAEVVPNGVEIESFSLRNLNLDTERAWIEMRMKEVGFERVMDVVSLRFPLEASSLKAIYEGQGLALFIRAILDKFGAEEVNAFREMITGQIPDDVEHIWVVVGKYVEWKGLHPLIDAIDQVNAKSAKKIMLLIMGSGSDIEKQHLVEHIAERSQGSHVGFLGFITDRERQSRIMQFCSEFKEGGGVVVAADREPFGLTPFEGLASGAKVLLPTSCGALSVILKGVDLRISSPDAIIDAMEQTGLGHAFKAYVGNAGRDLSLQDPDWGYRDPNGHYVSGTYSQRIAMALLK